MSEHTACMAYITTPTIEEAKQIARGLIEEQLIACANILPNMTSIYRWEGNIEEETECVLIAKTTTHHKQAVIDFVNVHHSYDVPCVLFYPVNSGNAAYLDWLYDAVTTP